MRQARALALLVGLGAARAAGAAPNLADARLAGPLTVYPDDRQPSLFYYAPGEVAVATDADGRPELLFLAVRYIGTAATGDQGAALFRSSLALAVLQTGTGPKELAAARAELAVGAELRPLPIQRLEAALVYAPTSAPEETVVLPAGHFESGANGPASGVWSERNYVLALEPNDAQLLWDSLQRGRLLLSLSCHFFALGPDAKAPLVLVKAGAFGVALDVARWPQLARRIDINETLPPGYGVLDIYCYDFNNALAPELYEKNVELEAVGVTGKKVRLVATFSTAQPDLYAKNVRFPLAVRLDRQPRYRIVETGLDGVERREEWAATSWGRVLDVTRPWAASPPPATEERTP